MSWEILIVPDPNQLRGYSAGQVLGTTDEVRDIVKGFAADVDWADPAWGVMQRYSFAIDFNLGEDSPVDSLLLHIHGTGPELSQFLRDFLDRTGWYAIDTAAGAWLHEMPDPSMGQEWAETFRKAKPLERQANWLDEVWDQVARWFASLK